MTVPLTVDNRVIHSDSGRNLLEVCLENGIYIPNLCHINGMKRPPASCRLCFVEIEGEAGPVLACTRGVTGGMAVRTDTTPVRAMQRSALQLLLSVHRVDCGHCPANRGCELQKLARVLKAGLKTASLDRRLKEIDIIETHPRFDYYPNRCVLCGRCEYICRERQERPILSFIKRGLDTGVLMRLDGDDPCGRCLACMEICPVRAITLKPGR
jgi:bidirectional [NiFe] hydrogenase diaphorase subunit